MNGTKIGNVKRPVRQRPKPSFWYFCMRKFQHWALQVKQVLIRSGRFVPILSPIVGIAETTSPSRSLYNIVVFPAASSPSIMKRISLWPNQRRHIAPMRENVGPMESEFVMAWAPCVCEIVSLNQQQNTTHNNTHTHTTERVLGTFLGMDTVNTYTNCDKQKLIRQF